MEGFTTKLKIGLLEGKSNWDTWKFKVSILLCGTEGAMDVTEGRFTRPIPSDEKGKDQNLSYNVELTKYIKAESNAMLILTTNMSEETLKKVMRFTTAYEIWQELHRLFDGKSEDKAYHLCMEFFGYKQKPEDDVATHMSKLKNIWNNLAHELITNEDHNCKLPDLFLICKILDTLDEKFFAFKSSWLLLNRQDKTIDNLTSQLCAYERSQSEQGKETSQEALVTKQNVQRHKKKLKCHYCLGFGHKVKGCKKWINDGRPPKPIKSDNEPASSNLVQNVTLMAVNACSLGEMPDKDNWFVDNGATTHITNRSDIFFEFHEFESSYTVTTANGNTIPAKGKGSVTVESNVHGRKELITLSDVWYVPSLMKNLFSTLAAQDKVQNSVFTSTTRECKLEINGVTHVIGRRMLKGGLYKLALKTVIPSNIVQVNTVTTVNKLQLYHERFGHQNKRHVKELVKRELGIELRYDDTKCEGCIYGKSHRLKFGTRERASKPGELIHTDVCGPFVYSYSKYRYFVLFKDDYSCYRYVYFIRNKSEVKQKLVQMLNEARTTGHVIKTILSDNGGEFDNGSIRDILSKHGIQQRLIMPYTPEQNGCSERENRTLVEAARSMMHTRTELPKALWAEMINTAAYVLNRTGPTRIKEKVPYELWYGKKPKISHLRVIGSVCYAHIPKQKRKKLDKKAIKGKLIGYDNDDGYRIWDGEHTVRSRDITFMSDIELRISCGIEKETTGVEGDIEEEIHETPQTRSKEIPESIQLEGENDVEEANDNVQPTVNDFNDNVEEDRVIEESEQEEEFIDAEDTLQCTDESTEIIEPRYNLRQRSMLQKPKKLDDYVLLSEAFPNTYKEAVEKMDKENWLKAMKEEMNSMKDNRVWKLEELPKGRKALPCKWIYRIKRNPDGSIEKYKARLVVKGFKQKKGIDYCETFSPVARMATIRALISVAAKENMHLMQFDVSTAFLNGNLLEEIYMEQPEGFNDGSTKVCRLLKSLYGLKQAPRCWNSCFAEILTDMDFKQNDADPCLFVKRIGLKKILITLYVDDGLVAATDENLVHDFMTELKKKLKITTKPASYYLGLEIKKLKDGCIKISQQAYAKKVLERFNMSECNPISTPIEKKSIVSGKVPEEGEEKFPYREAVGALAYLMVATRPDIAYAVGVISRVLENPTKADWLMVKRILRYIQGTLSRGIVYGRTEENVISYSDADHGGCGSTGRSTTGVLCLYAGGAVSWLSQRQATVAISTTEAEIVAASEAARELIWIKRIYADLAEANTIPVLHVDNEAAVRLAHNPEFHKRTKHIRIRHFFVREVVSNGDVELKRISTNLQAADIMTKALPKARHEMLCKIMGMGV